MFVNSRYGYGIQAKLHHRCNAFAKNVRWSKTISGQRRERGAAFLKGAESQANIATRPISSLSTTCATGAENAQNLK